MVYSSTARGSIVCLHFVFMYSKWDLDKIWHTYTRFQESIANRRRDCGRTKKSTAGSGQGELGTLKWGGLQLSSYGCLQSWSPPTLSTSLGGFTLARPSCMFLCLYLQGFRTTIPSEYILHSRHRMLSTFHKLCMKNTVSVLRDI